MTELYQNEATHYNVGGCSTSRLDMLYCSLPSWALINSAVQTRRLKDPIKLHKNKLSGHAPVVSRIGAKPLFPMRANAFPNTTLTSRSSPRSSTDYSPHLPRAKNNSSVCCSGGSPGSSVVTQMGHLLWLLWIR